MKQLAMAAAFAVALSNPASAAILGGLDWNIAGAGVLTLTPVIPNNNQPRNLPCIICGANQPLQPANFGYNLFGNQGNDTTLPYFSTSVVGGSLGADQFGGVLSGYTINAGSPFLSALAGNLTFSVGIDSNQAGTKDQVLESFWFLNFTTQTVLAVYLGGETIRPPNNGTGFPDYTLDGFSLAGINAGDRIGFFARITNANDGPDSFFLVPNGAITPIPIPGAVWMFGAGIVGLGFLARRRRQANVTA